MIASNDNAAAWLGAAACIQRGEATEVAASIKATSTKREFESPLNKG